MSKLEIVPRFNGGNGGVSVYIDVEGAQIGTFLSRAQAVEAVIDILQGVGVLDPDLKETLLELRRAANPRLLASVQFVEGQPRVSEPEAMCDCYTRTGVLCDACYTSLLPG